MEPPKMPAVMQGQTLARPSPLSAQDQQLLAKAKALEASFLAEMLGHAGLNGAPDHFNGGAGEEQFSSFLRAEQAKAMVAKGGIGLAEQIFDALKDRSSDAQRPNTH